MHAPRPSFAYAHELVVADSAGGVELVAVLGHEAVRPSNHTSGQMLGDAMD